ncbi:hypothetical protein GCM10011390_20770 [Aureimonas endophytica]|uniref:Transposase IS701-like DDE domain-containing protein n=1 Tax=Aureimonas endophytica TaxID=2027858 RepID=A0A916ZK12_9HYPH|nr:hypothetical protein GCM10011390_20770 [Aureimonas endophytica]
MRDIVRDYVVKHLGNDDAALVLDETGFLKHVSASCCVGRQYSGSAGKITNCQIGVFAAYASRRGHAFIDRALYLPKAWTGDRERLTAAHMPEEFGFATKPALAMKGELNINEQPGRAALVLPASSTMDEDGAILPRVQLVRPMQIEVMLEREFEKTHWKPARDLPFEAAWQAEVDQVPEFKVSTITVISGLLLPIWDKLPSLLQCVRLPAPDRGRRADHRSPYRTRRSPKAVRQARHHLQGPSYRSGNRRCRHGSRHDRRSRRKTPHSPLPDYGRVSN